jgi:signal transduction histidine kinase/CheY-like chemotaxis protein
MDTAIAIQSDTQSKINTEVLYKLLEFSEAILKGDFTKRVVTDFSDDVVTKISNNLNRFADQMQLDPTGLNYNQDQTVNSFIEVISSYTNLEFKHKLPVSDSGNIWDAIATGINMLGDELEQSTTSRKELELEQQKLKEAKEQAEQANKAKSQFLANMSHEIRTPLNGILGLTQIMQQEEVSEEFQKYLSMIHSSGSNLTKLINDILDFSKIESGKMELENILFDFRKTINDNLEHFHYLAEHKGIAMSCQFSDSVPTEVIGDPTRINQIMANLVGNAVKFTEKGSIEINFSVVGSKEDEVALQGSIRDTGIGIKSDSRDQVFQSFSQADNSVTRKFGGTGLGLSIAKRLVEMMQGDITVHGLSEAEGKGSVFTFSIKLKIPVRKKVSVGKKNLNLLNFKKEVKILVVDDNPINLLVARKMVQKFGADVTTAKNGREAINLVKENPFDIILMDIQMPELDGHAATIELRKMNFTNPIIAISANAFKEDVDNSINAGMDAHLQKPFADRELFQTINRYLEPVSK